MNRYDPWRAYGNSKLANRHFAQGLDRQFQAAGLSARALTAHPGSSFHTVLEHTRQALARHYLERPEITITEIALLLGYDEPSSFYRAFRQWSGTTPQQARAAVT